MSKKKQMGEPDYEVGYCKPPAKSQFKPGVSGNPKGRPKHPRQTDEIFGNALKRRISVSNGGAIQSMLAVDAIVRQMVTRAVKGDLKAANTALEYYELYASRFAEIEKGTTARSLSPRDVHPDYRDGLRILFQKITSPPAEDL